MQRTCEDGHERALAGAVVTEKRADLAGVHVQRDTPQRLRVAVRLGQLADAHGRVPLQRQASVCARGLDIVASQWPAAACTQFQSNSEL